MIFSKSCPVCNELFSSLTSYMTHIKKTHKDLPPSAFTQSGEETKWKLREDE